MRQTLLAGSVLLLAAGCGSTAAAGHAGGASRPSPVAPAVAPAANGALPAQGQGVVAQPAVAPATPAAPAVQSAPPAPPAGTQPAEGLNSPPCPQNPYPNLHRLCPV